MGIEISLCMIVKNEEDNLSRCLESVKGVADEIIIVDTGSSDGTIEIASRFTDKIFHFEWIDDFAAARNFSFSKGTKEYLMWMDADDYLTDDVREYLISAKAFFPEDLDFLLMDYYTRFDEDGKPISIVRRERIVRRACGFKWAGSIHECIPIKGKGYVSKMHVTHGRKDFAESAMRNVIKLHKNIESGTADSRDYFYYGGILFDAGREDEALPYIEKYLAEDNKRCIDGQKIYFIAHQIYMNRGEHDKALAVLRDNEPELSGKSEYHCLLGFLYRDTYGDLEKACDCFRLALDCEFAYLLGLSRDISRDYYYFIPYAALGQCQIKLGQYKEAYDSYCKALFYKPDDKETQAIAAKLRQALLLQSA